MFTSALTHDFKAFNTVNMVTAYTEDGSIVEAIEALHTRYELLFSRTNPQSALSSVNSAAGERVEVDEELARFITLALKYCEKSGGLFDITMGSVVRTWNFRAGLSPDQKSIDEALSHVDFRSVHVEGRTVWLDDPQATIDLGGIAKGYIADKILELLAGHQVQSGLVNLGGNVAVLGEKPDGQAWSVGIRLPESSLYQGGNKAFASLSVRDASVVTSGIYERAFMREGRLYHHILDPRTGYPAQSDLLGATVVSRRSLDGDGYTTALIIMGLDEALEFVEADPDLEAVFVATDGAVYATSAIGKDIPFSII
jgi:thiamine biosynthesis lipoprotein